MNPMTVHDTLQGASLPQKRETGSHQVFYKSLRCLKEILKAEPKYAFDIYKIATTSIEFQKSVQGPNTFILFIGGTQSDLKYY